MNIDQLDKISQLQKFLYGTQPILFEVNSNKSERYDFIRRTLVRFNYHLLKRKDKGVVIRFLMKITGYSRQQLTRLIQQYICSGTINHKPARSNGFQRYYTEEDVRLLAKMDQLHGNLNGHATKKLCERAVNIFGEVEYEKLSKISVSHLYNLRKTNGYNRSNKTFSKTKPKKSSIGVRRKPRPEGKPGYLRIDTVHQGDQDKAKGVYHINAVDEVTQYEVVLSVEKISEAYLKPILGLLLSIFPFKIRGFHSDNGGEYINGTVVKLLDKLHIELTKSRARRSNDNALVESKNGSVVRKIFGYSHIPQHYASLLNDFNQEHLIPYLNFHRPCFYARSKIDRKGKEKKQYLYKDMMTPFEKLKSLPDAASFLKMDITFEYLEKQAHKQSDNAACHAMNEARKILMAEIFGYADKKA